MQLSSAARQAYIHILNQKDKIFCGSEGTSYSRLAFLLRKCHCDKIIRVKPIVAMIPRADLNFGWLVIRIELI